MIYTIEFDSAGNAISAARYSDDSSDLLSSEVVCTKAQFDNYRAYVLVDGLIQSAPAETLSALSAETIRLQRDALVSSSDWIVRRQNDQVAAGTATTLTTEQYTAWLTYRQALRDVTKQSTFPTSVTWQTAPA